MFLHIRPGTEEAVLLALADSSNNPLAAQKADIDVAQIDAARQMIENTTGDVAVIFTDALSAAPQTVLPQIGNVLGGEGRRILLHPLARFNNSVGACHMRMNTNVSPFEMLDMAGDTIKAMYVAGGFLPEHLAGREDALSKLDFLVVQELFENETTAAADVVLPDASYAEVDGTF